MRENTASIYYPSFDFLRIILATVVAVGHSGIPIWHLSGNLAVQIFFAMSGWLIGGILLKSTIEDLPRFYFNRAARIWIPYFVAIGLLIVASLLKEPVTAKWLEFIFYKITFVYNFFGPPQLECCVNAMPLDGTGNHFWSIAAEEQFYLLAPFLLAVLPSRIGKSIWFWIVLTGFANFSDFWNYFGSISLGVLAAVVRQRFGDWHLTRVAQWPLAFLALTCICTAYFEIIAYRVGAPLFAVALMLLLARPGNHSKLATFLGGVSYPMYLNHWIGVFIANMGFALIGMRGSIIGQVSSVLISLAVAAILYIVIDLQVRLNRDRYFTKARGKLAAAFGFALVCVGILGRTIYF